MKYIVGYSGGIDSCYVAWSLKKQGHEVLLINLKITDDPNKCCNIQSEIFSTAKDLGLNLEIVDLTKEFKEFVIDDFSKCYLSGLTPNPCIRCNEFVRFKSLQNIRIQKGYDFLSTGHYANLVNYNGIQTLTLANDIYKDQTYMLYRLVKNGMLNNVAFPMGNLIKTNVIKEIFDNNLPILINKESQNICFIPDDDYKRYIRQNYLVQIPIGPVVDEFGKYIGEHKGIIYYTIGQKYPISGSEKKYFVLKIDKDKNTIIVGDAKSLFHDTICIKDYFMIGNNFNDLYGKIRYHSQFEKINNIEIIGDKCKIKFSQSQRAPTPGQHCVFYKEIDGIKIVYGGGIIE